MDMKDEKKEKFPMAKFIWRITYAHVISFVFAGIFAMIFMNYAELYAKEPLSLFMKPVTHPIVSLGMILQVIRGIIVALVLYPSRKAFFVEKYGLLKLGLIILGLSVLSTFGPGIGSVDGYIFTTLPISIHVLGYPEAIIWILLFIGILYLSDKFKDKKVIHIISITLMVLIFCIAIMGYVVAVYG